MSNLGAATAALESKATDLRRRHNEMQAEIAARAFEAFGTGNKQSSELLAKLEKLLQSETMNLRDQRLVGLALGEARQRQNEMASKFNRTPVASERMREAKALFGG